MGEVKQINIKNRTYYFYNDVVILKNFESNLLKILKKHYKEVNIYYIGYTAIKRISDSENIRSVNPLNLLVNHASEYIEEKIEINTWFLMNLLMKTKSHCNNSQRFGIELKTKSKQWMVVKKMITGKITCKLNLVLTTTCH